MTTRSSSIHDLATPALVLDWATAQRNIKGAAEFVQDKEVRLRPHFKNHKRVSLAREQLSAGGCVGMTTATLVEAEALVKGGIDDVLIANQIVGATNIIRLLELAKRSKLRVAVDNIANAEMIAKAAQGQGIEIGVLIEVDVGMGRCGVAPGDATVELAEKISPLSGIRLDGLQAYEGHAVGIVDPIERESVATASIEKATRSRRQLEAEGFECGIVSSAGTGTFRTTGLLEGVTELQVGSYVTMDWSYKERVGDQFDIALTILASVISVREDHFVVNAGCKAIGHEMGPPRLRDFASAEIPRFGAEEHTVVHLPAHNLKVGDVVHVIPSHCCMTCALHRDMVVYEGERIRDIWQADVGYGRSR